MARPIITYPVASSFERRVAYFSMEFALDQALKTYSGGLGFLAGSHIRSAYELGQNLVGISILWKYGYYDQVRDTDTGMKPVYVEKDYSFLEDTRIVFTVPVHNSPVHVKAMLLRPETFRTAPVFLLTTDIPENDFLSRSITHRLYDSNEATRIAQSIILGAGGARLLDLLEFRPDVYHMNEGHALPLAFYLYNQAKSLDAVREKVVFTTHTPEAAGNEEHRYGILEKMSFFQGLHEDQVRHLLRLEGPAFNYTLAALKFARKANGVSRMHSEVARRMWSGHPGVCEIRAVTNAQNQTFWTDPAYRKHLEAHHDDLIRLRKKEMKRELFQLVADQTGKLFQERIFTLV
ncbi:MAG TPA: alpha-glucan family phosphorylase, partial [Sphingobacteriaceae bacterium]